MRCWQLGDGAWKTSMVSVKKWTGVGKSGVGEEWGASVTAKPFLPGYLVQFIYLQAANLQFSPSSKGCDLLGCSGWLTHVFISPCRKYLKLAYCGLLGSSRNPTKTVNWLDFRKEKQKVHRVRASVRRTDLWKIVFTGKYPQRKTYSYNSI